VTEIQVLDLPILLHPDGRETATPAPATDDPLAEVKAMLLRLTELRQLEASKDRITGPSGNAGCGAGAAVVGGLGRPTTPPWCGWARR
jgi:hypothetical protein